METHKLIATLLSNFIANEIQNVPQKHLQNSSLV